MKKSNAGKANTCKPFVIKKEVITKMKSKKTLKKALAGISAIAMIGTALPTSLLASAVSYTNVLNTDTTPVGAPSYNREYGFGALVDTLTKNKENTKSNLVATDVTATLKTFSSATLDNFDFRLKKYQIESKDVTDAEAITATESGTVTATKTTRSHAVAWDTDAAAKDVAAMLGEDVTAVSFYDEPDDEEYGCDVYGEDDDTESGANFIENRYGKIKSITINMPINTGVGGAGEIKYEPKEFMVARTGKDIDKATGMGGSEVGVILVRDINLSTGEDTATGGAALAAAKKTLQDSIVVSARKLVVDKIKEAVKEVDLKTLNTPVEAGADECEISKKVNEITEFTVSLPNTLSDAKNVANIMITEIQKTTKKGTSAGEFGDVYAKTATTEQNVLNAIIDKVNAYNYEVVSADATSSAKTKVQAIADYFHKDSTNNGIIDGDDADGNNTADDEVEWKDGKNFVNWYKDFNKIEEQITTGSNINLALNGHVLTTSKGIMTIGKKLRIWGAETPGNGTTLNTITTTNTNSPTLTSFGETAVIEVYDNVYVGNAYTSGAYAITGKDGTFIMCGDNVTIKSLGDHQAVDTNTNTNLTFEYGDYDYTYKKSDTTTAPTANALTGSDTAYITTLKKHYFNKLGLEVDTRPADPDSNTGKKEIADSTKYTDANPKTEKMEYGYEPAYSTDGYKAGTKVRDVTPGTLSATGTAQNIYITNIGQLMWMGAQWSTIDNYAEGTGNLTIHIDGIIDFAQGPSDLVWTPVDASNNLITTYKIIIDGSSTAKAETANGTEYTAKTYSVIKNMKIASSDGDAAMFSKTGSALVGVGKTNESTLEEKLNGNGTSKNLGDLDTGSLHKMQIQYLGFENTTVAATANKAYAAVVVGAAYDTLIKNVYVAEPNVSGTYKAAIAGTYSGASTVQGTFTYGAYDPIFSFLDNDSRNQLASDNTYKDMYYTNFYTKDYPNGIASTGYFIGETVDHFADGTVAFRLNGHNPDLEIEGGSSTPVEWENGKNNSTATVNKAASGLTSSDGWAGSSYGSFLKEWYKKGYSADVFGQAIGTAKYPTFLVNGWDSGANVPSANQISGALAVNRVYRQISMDCSGKREAWSNDDKVKFANKEVNYTNKHVDENTDGRCDRCNAYKINHTDSKGNAMFFDKALWNGLTTTSNEGWLTFSEISTIREAKFDLRDKVNTSWKVDTLINAINKCDSKTYACDVKGFDILNKSYTSGNEGLSDPTNSSRIITISFTVDDSIICAVDAAEDIANTAFYIGSVAYKTGAPYKASTASTDYSALVTIGSYKANIPNAVGYTSPKQGDVMKYYVIADADATEKGRSATAHFQAVKENFNSNAPKIDYEYVINFDGGIKHNDKVGSENYDDGLYPESGYRNSSGVLTSSDTNLVVNTDDGYRRKSDNKLLAGYHTKYNGTCYCILAEETHKATYSITNTGHIGVCEQVGCKHTAIDLSVELGSASTGDEVTADTVGWTQVKDTDNYPQLNANGYEPHEYKVVYTFGSMVFKRCVVCGFTTFAADTAIVPQSTAPELSIVVDDAGKSLYRQTYMFDIAAGDNKIVSYGVLYNVDGKAISTPSTYVNESTGSLKTDLLASAGINYTSKTAIKESGTYTLYKSLESADSTLNVVGYVIYNTSKTDTPSYKAAYTSAISNTFYNAAKDEVQNACAIEMGTAEKVTNASTGAAGDTFTYKMELSNGCIATKVGYICSLLEENDLTENTTLADVDGTKIRKGTEKNNPSPNARRIKYYFTRGRSTAEGAKTTTMAYMIVTNEKYGDLQFEVYSPVTAQASK